LPAARVAEGPTASPICTYGLQAREIKPIRMSTSNDITSTLAGGDSEPSTIAGPAAASALCVQVARSREEVEAIRSIWSSWKSDRDNDIDYCLQVVWSSADFIRPHVIVIYRNGCPDAMLVGRLDRARIDTKIGFLRIPGMRVRRLMFASGGFLGNSSPENCEELINSINDALKRKEADAALFQHLSTESAALEKALSLPSVTSRDHLVKQVPHSILRLSGSVERVYMGFSPGLRTELRRKKRKVVRDFGSGVKIECFRELAQLETVIPQVEQIMKKTYQRALGVGFQDTEPVHRRLRFYAERGWLRIYLLTINGQPSAFCIGPFYDGRFYVDYLGFYPKLGAYSPGTVLFAAMIEDLCALGVKEVELGPGAGRYKQRFGNYHWAESSVYIFAPGLKGIVLNTVRAATGVASSTIHKVLEFTSLLPRIKRFWRSRLASHAHQIAA
jgi:GNAT acetyltransferase-like protein